MFGISATGSESETEDLNKLMHLNMAELQRLIPYDDSDHEDQDGDVIQDAASLVFWPSHEFVKSTKEIKSGKNKSELCHLLSLVEHPYIYRRKKLAKNWTIFICNECEKINENIFAFATVEFIDKEDHSQDIYTLEKLPISENHVCAPCGSEMYEINDASSS